MLFESFYDAEKSQDRTGYSFDQAQEESVISTSEKKKRIWTVDYLLDIVHWNKFIK